MYNVHCTYRFFVQYALGISLFNTLHKKIANDRCEDRLHSPGYQTTGSLTHLGIRPRGD